MQQSALRSSIAGLVLVLVPVVAALPGEEVAVPSSPWALVEEQNQRVPCEAIAEALEAGGGGPLLRLDEADTAQHPDGAWQCYWDSPSGVYFYAEFDVDLVAPVQQLSAGLRDFRAAVKRECGRVQWSQSVRPAPDYRLVARGRAQCIGEDSELKGQHVLMWLTEDGFGQRLLNLQHNHYAGDSHHEAALGTLIGFMESRSAGNPLL